MELDDVQTGVIELYGVQMGIVQLDSVEMAVVELDDGYRRTRWQRTGWCMNQ